MARTSRSPPSDSDGALTALPSSVAAPTGEAQRLTFQPQPTPKASSTVTTGRPGATTAFDATGSARAVRYDWDFGDGSTSVDGGPTPTHVYATAGDYTATLTVTDAQGCSTRQVYTGQSTVCPGGADASASSALSIASATVPPVSVPATPVLPPATITKKPVIGHLVIAPHTFLAAVSGVSKRKAGAVFSYRLSVAATVRFTIARRHSGRRVGTTCRKPSRTNAKHRPCTLFVSLGTQTARAKAGRNSLRFTGRVQGRTLTPGAYRVTAVATDAAGSRSRPVRALFHVIR